jgi:hypothetical protein
MAWIGDRASGGCTWPGRRRARPSGLATFGARGGIAAAALPRGAVLEDPAVSASRPAGRGRRRPRGRRGAGGPAWAPPTRRQAVGPRGRDGP